MDCIFTEHNDDGFCIGKAYEGVPVCSQEETLRIGNMIENGLLNTLKDFLTEMCRYLYNNQVTFW